MMVMIRSIILVSGVLVGSVGMKKLCVICFIGGCIIMNIGISVRLFVISISVKCLKWWKFLVDVVSIIRIVVVYMF